MIRAAWIPVVLLALAAPVAAQVVSTGRGGAPESEALMLRVQR
jgi:hypothetical protein